SVDSPEDASALFLSVDSPDAVSLLFVESSDDEVSLSVDPLACLNAVAGKINEINSKSTNKLDILFMFLLLLSYIYTVLCTRIFQQGIDISDLLTCWIQLEMISYLLEVCLLRCLIFLHL